MKRPEDVYNSYPKPYGHSYDRDEICDMMNIYANSIKSENKGMRTIPALIYWFVGLLSAGFMIMFPMAYMIGDKDGKFIRECDPLNISIMFGVIGLWILYTVINFTQKLQSNA